MIDRGKKSYYHDLPRRSIIRNKIQADVDLKLGDKETTVVNRKPLLLEVTEISTDEIIFHWDSIRDFVTGEIIMSLPKDKLDRLEQFINRTLATSAEEWEGIIEQINTDLAKINCGFDSYDPEEKVHKRHFIKSHPDDRNVSIEELNLKPETLQELTRYKLMYIHELDVLGATHEFVNLHLNLPDGFEDKDVVEEFHVRGRSLGETFPISPICNYNFPQEFIEGSSPLQVYKLQIVHQHQVDYGNTHYGTTVTKKLLQWKVQIFPALNWVDGEEISDSDLVNFEPCKEEVQYGAMMLEEIIPNTRIEETQTNAGKTIMRLTPESYADINQALAKWRRND